MSNDSSNNITTNTMRSLLEAANGINEAAAGSIPRANFTADQYELYHSSQAAANRINAILNTAVRKYYTRFPKVTEYEYKWGGGDYLKSRPFEQVKKLMNEAGSEVSSKMRKDDIIQNAGGGDSEPYRVVRRYMVSAATAALGFDPQYSYF